MSTHDNIKFENFLNLSLFMILAPVLNGDSELCSKNQSISTQYNNMLAQIESRTLHSIQTTFPFFVWSHLIVILLSRLSTHSTNLFELTYFFCQAKPDSETQIIIRYFLCAVSVNAEIELIQNSHHINLFLSVNSEPSYKYSIRSRDFRL